MVKQAKIEKIIEKAQTGTDLMIQLYDEWLKDLGFHLMTSRDSEKRGGHISLMHEHAKNISVSLREFERVIVDYRVPDQIRIAISPLAMSYNEIYRGMKKIRDSVARKDYLKIKNKTSEVT